MQSFIMIMSKNVEPRIVHREWQGEACVALPSDTRKKKIYTKSIQRGMSVMDGWTTLLYRCKDK